MPDNKMFFFLPIIKKITTSTYITDNDNYVIGRSENDKATWIWTKDEISEKKTQDIIKNIQDKILTNNRNTITCRKRLFDEINKVWSITNYSEIGYLECNKLKDIKLASGFIDRPKYSDKIDLAHFWQDYSKELSNPQNITMTESLREIETWMEDETFYVWREKNGKIVCMANYWANDGIAKISYVYTPLEKRNKGYCKSLIHELTKTILNNKLKPMLYTDNHNNAANKAYQSVGYEQKEILIRFDITNQYATKN